MTTLHKIWAGTTQTSDTSITDGDYSAADNWLVNSIRDGSYKWTLSTGGGTNEYYLELAAGGDPGLAQPANVQELVSGTRTNLTSGTAGSLAVSEWGWGDVDTLGYNTIYVRTSGEVDPDTLSTDTITLTSIPATGDDVTIPATSSTAISSGLDQSSVAINKFEVEKGYKKNIGANGTPLYIDPDVFTMNASGGTQYIDIGAAAIDVQITGTGTAQTGQSALYLTGTAIDEAAVAGGSVRFVNSTITTLRTNGGTVIVDSDSTLTTYLGYKGVVTIRCAFTTGTNYGATLTTEGSGAVSTINSYGGKTYPNSTGLLTTLLNQGGSVDMTKVALARTVTNVKQNKGTLRFDSAVVTITNWQTPDYPVQHITSQAT